MTYLGRRDVHTTAELEAATGYGYRTLRRWVVAGVLPPPRKVGRGLGRGVIALWSADALRTARAVATLRRQGFSLEAAATMAARSLADPARKRR
jgi:DNA-binding transcriptional MerR regulator